jgi:hypothetical protein
MKNKDERFYPPDCSCKPLAFGQVTFYDPDLKGPTTHRIALRAIRSRTCNVHGVENHRCGGRYLPAMVSS